MQNGKIFEIEITTEKETGGHYSATLYLPAFPEQIADARQAARMLPLNNRSSDVSVIDSVCPTYLEFKRLYPTSVEELNYYAKRIMSLNDEQRAIHQALFNIYCEEHDGGMVSIKDLINLTFNLDTVPIVSNVSTPEELGQFVIDQSLDTRLESVPEELIPVIDREKLGLMQMESDVGGFIDNMYIPTVHYEPVKVYDGVHIPDIDEDSDTVILVTATKGSKSVSISLPQNSKTVPEALYHLDVSRIEDCRLADIASVIPNISMQTVHSMNDFSMLNRVALTYWGMNDGDRAKFKAVIEAEELTGLSDMLDAAHRLSEYELDIESDSDQSFFAHYLSRFLDKRFDSRWLEAGSFYSVGAKLLERMCAHVTSYGVLSARCGNLFDPVPYDERSMAEEKKPITTEKFNVIEILGRPALFSDARISQADLPEGLYVSDFRGDDDGGGRFVSVEPKVIVNHSGAVITKEPFDFGESGFISLDDDSSPNFLGYDMTVEEFANAEFEPDEEIEVDQTDDEDNGMGGMNL